MEEVSALDKLAECAGHLVRGTLVAQRAQVRSAAVVHRGIDGEAQAGGGGAGQLAASSHAGSGGPCEPAVSWLRRIAVVTTPAWLKACGVLPR